MSSSSLSRYIRSVTVLEPSLRPCAALERPLTPPSRPLVENNSTELLRMTLRIYKGRATVSVRPPYNNRRASVHLHKRTFRERHDGCTERPSPTVPDHLYGWPRMKGSRQFYGRPVSSMEVLNDSKLPLCWIRSGASAKLTDRCPNSSFLFPNASLSASVTFPELPSIKNLTDAPRLLYGGLTDTAIRPLENRSIICRISVEFLRRGRYYRDVSRAALGRKDGWTTVTLRMNPDRLSQLRGWHHLSRDQRLQPTSPDRCTSGA